MDEIVRKRKLKSRAGRKAAEAEQHLLEETSTLHSMSFYFEWPFQFFKFQSKTIRIMRVEVGWTFLSIPVQICGLTMFLTVVTHQRSRCILSKVTKRLSMLF